MIFEIRRKLFHFTALIYVAGVYYLPRERFIQLVALLLAVNFIFEVLRLKVPAVKDFFLRTASGILREEEQTHFSGVVWMLAGVLITAILVEPTPLVMALYLYLILGDAAASLIGKSVQGPTWSSESKKRISGSLACFLTCVIIGIVLIKEPYGWRGIVAGALTATVLEFGLPKLNDNLTIPVGCALMFKLLFGT